MMTHATDGLYWIDLDGEGGDPAFTAICDMENGGWTQLYGNYDHSSNQAAWRLDYNTTINRGKNFNQAQPAELPHAHQSMATGRRCRVPLSENGTIGLSGFNIDRGNDYALRFTPTENSR